ncbi:hypothetical protein [Mediterranea massiliensis]|uniref:hypothetical protein n=1 Tax=Mediterranea massiliensis TaxID=1841865 RepID=UPI00111505BD|nr:hypothetical protein [Mediterranea massiliensis]
MKQENKCPNTLHTSPNNVEETTNKAANKIYSSQSHYNSKPFANFATISGSLLRQALKGHMINERCY